jgi:hypothetical protein
VPKLQRGALLLGLFATLSLGFALAPYLCLLTVCVLAMVVRTVSWTTESARDRQLRRGRRRWYDPVLTAVSSPWYAVIATAGTLLLLLWSAAVAFTAGFAYLLFSLPLVPGLLLMGALLGISLWWGPGSRRIRTPVRRLVLAGTSRAWTGWFAIAFLAVVAALCAYALLTGGVLWDPKPGPPWRSGTLLGDLLHWL